MIQRCTCTTYSQYADYGGRGITVCERWRNSFENFLADMGPRPEGATLDRYPNNDGNYEPGNCRWATRFEQNQNTRKSVHVMFAGERLSMSEFARRIELPRSTALQRIRKTGELRGGVLLIR